MQILNKQVFSTLTCNGPAVISLHEMIFSELYCLVYIVTHKGADNRIKFRE